jgi:hypothetical protein
VPSASSFKGRPPAPSPWASKIPGFGFGFGPRGGRKNKTGKRRTSAPARKKSTYVPSFSIFVLVRFGRFSARGLRKHGFQQNHRGNVFFGGKHFFRMDFFNSFSFDFLLVALSIFLVRFWAFLDERRNEEPVTS